MAAEFDTVIRNATVYDGSGGAPFRADIGIKGDRISQIAPNLPAAGAAIIDVHGLAAAPGFINMLSWANESLLADGRSQSDIRQGVTLEVLGEGESMGPLNPEMRKNMKENQGDIKFDVTWNTLGEYLDQIVSDGISPNIASFVGATTVRIHELGYADRPPTAEELTRMQKLVREAMEEGAMGISSSLIYAPAFYAKTDELIALAKAAEPYGGIYISHMRSEGNRLFEAFDELLRISREAKIPAEIYHLKAAGRENWHKLDELVKRIENARAEGLKITADMYSYIAGATGLDAAMPPWVQEGGYNKWAERLRDPAIRERVGREMRTPTDQWENFFLAPGSPDKILLVGFKNEALKPLTGKTLAEAARVRGKSPEETAMDLVIEDGSRVSTVYFLMSEENVRKEIKLPWVSFGSDEGSYAPEGVFLKSMCHPRSYGNVARFLGKYVREEKLVPLQEAVRRLSAFPAQNLSIKDRGLLKTSYFADIVIFDPDKIQDHATFDNSNRYSTGVLHVWVNGKQVLKDGEHTGAKPGRILRGPGWRPKAAQ
jgi:N-acyl-D-amino-acid deacylase